MSTPSEIKVTIKRAPHDKEHPYVMISNAMFRDKSISPKAKGVLGYLLGLPSNWITHPLKLAEDLAVGRDYILSALKELIDSGYCRYTQKREAGKFMEGYYEFSEHPEFKKVLPKTPFPDTVSPETANHPLQNNEVILDKVPSPLKQKSPPKEQQKNKQEDFVVPLKGDNLFPSEASLSAYKYLLNVGFESTSAILLTTQYTPEEISLASQYVEQQYIKKRSKGESIPNIVGYLRSALQNQYWQKK